MCEEGVGTTRLVYPLQRERLSAQLRAMGVMQFTRFEHVLNILAQKAKQYSAFILKLQFPKLKCSEDS